MYIVGAGPGDPELLTLRAYKLLEEADVVLYDRLVGEEIVEMLRRMGKRTIYVGKQRGEDGSRRQEEINRLMKELASSGKVVVRLKGGDPCVFGRVAEEMLFLAENGIEFEVVPGVSSVNGVAGSVMIPLTHRELGKAVVVVSGRDADILGARGDVTFVVLMGGSKAHEVAVKLVRAGMAAETPTAVIERGTMRDQKLYISTLGEIIEKKPEFGSPAMMIVGKVVEVASRVFQIINKSFLKVGD